MFNKKYLYIILLMLFGGAMSGHAQLALTLDDPQLSFATRMEDWTCLGQHKRQPEFPIVTRESRRNSRKTTWFPVIAR